MRGRIASEDANSQETALDSVLFRVLRVPKWHSNPIADRVLRKRQRLPSNALIDSVPASLFARSVKTVFRNTSDKNLTSIVTFTTPNGRASPPSVALDYWGRLRRRSHSPRAERIKVKPPSPPSAQSIQTKKKPPGDLAISP